VAAGPASAQTTTTTTPLSCAFTVTPTTVTPGQSVTVSGTAPGTTQVTILLNGVPAPGASPSATVLSDPVTGAFGPVTVPITQAGTNQISIQLPVNYASLVCVGNGGTDVVEVLANAASQALPRTGSDTSTYVLVGVVLVGVGAALVVGARRRRNARTHV
jgi:LPXTG-motif cell wall-anchored protein